LGHNGTTNGTSLAMRDIAGLQEVDKSEVDLCKNISTSLKRQYGSRGVPPEVPDLLSFKVLIIILQVAPNNNH